MSAARGATSSSLEVKPFVLRKTSVLLILFGVWWSGCHSGSNYRTALGEAGRAKAEGRSQRAQVLYLEAARLALDDEERVEALYREIHLRRRLGATSLEQARSLLELANQYPMSLRAPRARLDAARLFERAGEIELAQSTYLLVLSRDPKSPIAISALLAFLNSEERIEERLRWIERLAHDSPEFSEPLAYERAKCLEQIDPSQALAAYERLAQDHPLPRGVYADEALLRAATIRKELGDKFGALTLLDVLAEAGTKAHLMGSYTRTSYAIADLERARLRRELGQLQTAQEILEEFETRHPTSRLRDDALWELAFLLLQSGQEPQACQLVERLAQLGSRFARCKSHLCGVPPADDEPRFCPVPAREPRP